MLTANMLLTLVQGLVATGIEAVPAWNVVSALYKENRAPTADEWAMANMTEDNAYAAVQALDVDQSPMPTPAAA